MLTEPQRLFPGRPVKRRAGLLAFTGPIAFQEDCLGDQPVVAGGHPGLGLPGPWGLPASSPTCRAAREAAEARERWAWPRPHDEAVSGPSDSGEEGRPLGGGDTGVVLGGKVRGGALLVACSSDLGQVA